MVQKVGRINIAGLLRSLVSRRWCWKKLNLIGKARLPGRYIGWTERLHKNFSVPIELAFTKHTGLRAEPQPNLSIGPEDGKNVAKDSCDCG